LSFVYNVPGYGGENKTYLIRRGIVRAELATPRSTRERRVLRQLTEEIFAGREPAGASIPTHEIDELLLLSSWFRKYPDEMQRTQAVA
jgi:excinuclease ABC subunit C